MKTKTAKVRVYSENYSEDLLKMYMEADFNYGMKLEVGKVVEGIILGQTNSHILVDIGYKDCVFIDLKRDELIALEKLGKTDGDKTEVMITNVSDEPYIIMGSFTQLNRKDAFSEILKNVDNITFTSKVLEWSPAGFKLDITYDEHKIPAFMPNTLAGINKLSQEQSQELVGKEVEVMIESFSDERGTFIASRKKFLQTLIPTALKNLKIRNDDGSYAMMTGVVTGTTKSSVFVEFNECLTGMIHISNLEHSVASRIDSIKPGDPINFYVKEELKGKLFLTQVIRTSAWDTVAKDDIFNNVKVKDVKKFGVLVQIDQETVGLISNNEIEKSKKTLKVGDTVNVKVTYIQRMDRKLSLSIV
jgi:ribosomal protein S1